MSDYLTPDQVHDWVTYLQAERQKGADRLHAQATTNDARKPKLTDAESAAIARARIDQGRTP